MQAGRTVSEAGHSIKAVLAKVHELVERTLGKAIGTQQVRATRTGHSTGAQILVQPLECLLHLSDSSVM